MVHINDDVICLIERSNAGATDLHIRSTEEQLSVVFPKQYQALFKLTNNAQLGEWTLFPIKNPKSLKRTWDDIVRQVLNFSSPAGTVHFLLAATKRSTSVTFSITKITDKYILTEIIIISSENLIMPTI
ncbi:SMI1/KNR4 family protein [Sporosarcina globispora]|uniref:SMI1/KNR4 family protein n=1 Tax=Sporosarcina globispora TaxID=1459 RepID=UPI0009E6942B|nr:SMI1/KNR4 family protein [Sporosarcina globispora]